MRLPKRHRRDKYGIHFYQHHQNPPLILGKGGFGRQLADWLSAEGWGEAEFLDDSAPGCVGGLRDYADPKLLKPGRPAFVALGDNALRVELLQKLAAAGYDTPVFISDMAAVSPSAVLEPGCVILPQAYVGADAHLGVGCIINGGAIVDHDAVLGRGVHVAPGRHRKGRCRGGSPNQGGFWGNH